MPLQLLDIGLDGEDWNLYKAWAVARLTGRWPLAIFGLDFLPLCLEYCPLCNYKEPGLRHLLADCPGTQALYDEWAAMVSGEPRSSGRLSWTDLRLSIFGGRMGRFLADGPQCCAWVRLVGRCSLAAANAMKEQQSV